MVEMAADDVGDLQEARTMTEVGTKLDLARAYVDMGDSDAARNLLNRVSVIGTASEVTEAKKMLVSLSDD